MIVGSGSEDAFVKALNKAFRIDLFAPRWRDLKSQLLNSFHIMVAVLGGGFES